MTADRPRPGPRFGAGLRHPGRWLDELTGDGPSLALVILFGLNAVDELARVALSIAGPSIADEFDTGMAGVTVPFVLAFGGALALSVPIATIADRGNRVRLALLGGVVFSVFSVAVGLAWSLWGLAFALAGMQVGKAFIEPSHTSLLTDYYPVDRRPRVFAVYRAGNAVGALVGGVAAGVGEHGGHLPVARHRRASPRPGPPRSAFSATRTSSNSPIPTSPTRCRRTSSRRAAGSASPTSTG